MRLPQSRFAVQSRPKTGRRVFTIVIVSVAVVLLAGGVYLIVRLRSPIVPIAETTRVEDALEAWNVGDYPLVYERSTEQLEEYPMDETALSLRGFSQFYLAVELVDTERRHELLKGAIRDLRRALLVREPVFEAEIFYILGKTYFTLGSYYYDESIQALQRARELGIDRLDLLEYLALAHRDLGRSEEAVSYFEEAIERDGEAVHILALAELLLDEEQYLRADALFLDVIDASADTTIVQRAYQRLGRSYREQERYEESVSTYQSLLQINESSAEAHFGLGETYLALGENERARFEWREAIRLDPNHIESLQRLREY
jgi:tetratricopeptide (TPR) repeat protein